MEEQEESPILLVTHVNNILHTISTNVEVCINSQQFYNSNEVNAHKLYNGNNFKGAISDYKEVFYCKGYYYEEVPDEVTEAPLSETFLTRVLKIFRRPDGFMLFIKLGIGFFSNSEFLHPIRKIRLRLIRT